MDIQRIGKKTGWIVLTAIVPLLFFFSNPLKMELQQLAVVSLLLLTIIWWSTGVVQRTVASCMLLLGFALFSNVPAKTIFTFPLSDTFLLITLTYLFSRGVQNSGLPSRYLETMLFRRGNTPWRAMLFAVAMLFITMYAIPQPLARLIIVGDIFWSYLQKTEAKANQRSVLMFSVYVIYIFVNLCSMNADIILNTTSVHVAGLDMADWDWIRAMAVPSLVYLAIAMGLITLLFRRELRGCSLRLQADQAEPKPQTVEKPMASGRDRMLLLLLGITIVLWFTEPLHGIPAWAVTLVSIGVMFAMKVLRVKDFRAIDVQMLVFLTAALSIGGVMRATGTADIVFSKISAIMPENSIALMVLTIMLISICMHMVLGSNTTTISVVVPGLVFICGDMLPIPVIMFLVYVTLTTQWLFPFHSVGLMMGTAGNYFPSGYILRMGLVMTIVVFIAVFGLYIPWWRFIGLLV